MIIQVKSFRVAGLVLVTLMLAILGFVSSRVLVTNQNEQNVPAPQSQSPTHVPSPAIPTGFKEYKDSKNRFSFFYPELWETKPNQNNGAQVSFIRPSLKEKITKGNGVSNGQYFYEESGFSLVVSHWDDINEVIEDEFSGKRQYSSLAEFINDPQVPTKKIGEISLNGAQGHEVINPGVSTQYAILFERPDGIYQIEFSDIPQKENLSDDDKKIIESFRF